MVSMGGFSGESMGYRPIEEIQAELEAAIIARDKTEAELAKSVKPMYIFTLVLHTDKFDLAKVFDPSCSLYRLVGRCTNKKEMEAVHKFPHEGAMTYVFNTLSHKFVMAVGGGSIFTSDAEAWEELSDFVSYGHSQGGDVTHIVSKYFPKG